MPDSADAAAVIRDWMLGVIEKTGWSPASWAKKAGVAGSTVQRAIKPTYEFMTSSRTLAKLAAVADVEPPAIRQGGDSRIVPRFLPVRFRVQAGHWYEMDTEEPLEQFEHGVAPNPRFANWPQWLEEVRGDSANKRIQPGQFVHVVDAIEMGYAPRDGDWVVIERRRNQGAERERSVKQLAIRPDGRVEAWPRSHNPHWSQPLRLNNAGPRVVSVSGEMADEGVEVEIVGLVIGVYDPML